MAVDTEVGICHDTDAFNVGNGGVLPDPFPAKKPAGRGVSLIVDGVPIANFSTITSSGGEPETIDVTTHDTPGRYREERSSFSTPLEASFDIIYDPTHPSHIWLGYLFQTGKVVPVVVQIWNGVLDQAAEILFSGQVTAFPMPSFPIDGPYTLSITIGGIKNIRFPGMDQAPPDKPVKYAFGGCPGVFLPVRDKGAPDTAIPSSTELTTQKIHAFPSTPWGSSMRVATSDGKNMSWDGKKWVELKPLATTAKSDGTFLPATSRPPGTLAELKNLTAEPQTPWTGDQKVNVDTKDFTWNGSDWVPWIKATGIGPADPATLEHKFTPQGAQALANLAALRASNITPANPTAAWKTGEYIALGTGMAHWAGSAASPTWAADKA